ncbi:MAG: PIN domain-containing protein [Actinomycetota bacterium]|nr:PIN domain-containing protein [Actinomycetota bacterium]
MKFWDTSALLPLCLEEAHTKIMKKIINDDESMVVWWGSLVEGYSAIARLKREGVLDLVAERQVYNLLKVLSSGWIEVEPSNEVRQLALRLLRLHNLRAADALQLAAALVWVEKSPADQGFVSLDFRLREAAQNEGFSVLPAEL